MKMPLTLGQHFAHKIDIGRIVVDQQDFRRGFHRSERIASRIPPRAL
jgi:hypothetical protein